MPIYEFKCKKCGHEFENLSFSMQEKQRVSCPVCRSKRTERLMSIFGGKFGNTASSAAGCSSCSTTSCPPS